jgi:hypothetical protein
VAVVLDVVVDCLDQGGRPRGGGGIRCGVLCQGLNPTSSIACEENWRLLVPLSRTNEAYHALAHARKQASCGGWDSNPHVLSDSAF